MKVLWRCSKIGPFCGFGNFFRSILFSFFHSTTMTILTDQSVLECLRSCGIRTRARKSCASIILRRVNAQRIIPNKSIKWPKTDIHLSTCWFIIVFCKLIDLLNLNEQNVNKNEWTWTIIDDARLIAACLMYWEIGRKQKKISHVYILWNRKMCDWTDSNNAIYVRSIKSIYKNGFGTLYSFIRK